ncbi:MAG: hypothetical protein HEEMFOPI_00840 [Holosporales bacterium]
MRLALTLASAVLLSACSTDTKVENEMTTPEVAKSATDSCDCTKATKAHVKKKVHHKKKKAATPVAEHKEEAKKEAAPAEHKEEASK